MPYLRIGEYAHRAIQKLSACLLLIFVGCSGSESTPFDHLIIPTDSGVAWRSVDAEQAAALIGDLDYSATTDSLFAANFLAGQLQAFVYSLKADGEETLRDSSLTLPKDNSGIQWISSLLPDEKSFASERAQEMFTFSIYDIEDAATLRVKAIPGSKVADALSVIDLHYDAERNKLTQVDVYRNGGGLFFWETSKALVRFSENPHTRFEGLDYTVAIGLPFREPTAFRSVLTVVGSP